MWGPAARQLHRSHQQWPCQVLSQQGQHRLWALARACHLTSTLRPWKQVHVRSPPHPRSCHLQHPPRLPGAAALQAPKPGRHAIMLTHCWWASGLSPGPPPSPPPCTSLHSSPAAHPSSRPPPLLQQLATPPAPHQQQPQQLLPVLLTTLHPLPLPLTQTLLLQPHHLLLPQLHALQLQQPPPPAAMDFLLLYLPPQLLQSARRRLLTWHLQLRHPAAHQQHRQLLRW